MHKSNRRVVAPDSLFDLRTGEQNAPLIDEILSLKQKQAKLLGFESYADVSLASKMAASVAEIEELHELLAAKATPAAHRELKELKEYASSKGHEGNLEHWDVPYWAERLREERFDYSDELCGNQPVSRCTDVAALAPSSGEEPTSPRHRAGVASMAYAP